MGDFVVGRLFRRAQMSWVILSWAILSQGAIVWAILSQAIMSRAILTGNRKIVSMEGRIKHYGSLLGILVLELLELRRQNVELTSKLNKSRSLEARCEVYNNNNNKNNIDSELGSKPTSSPHPSIEALPPPPLAPIPSQTHALVEGTQVINNGELILITNFIDADISDYRKVAFVVLTA